MDEEHSAQASNMNKCPHCDHLNRPGVLVCENCDRRMVGRPDSTIQLRDLTGKRQTTGSYPEFDDPAEDNLLHLQIANAPMSVKIDPQQQTILGRANPNRPQQPDVDLSAFKALEHGVSSVHAMIDTHDGKIVIADLGSANGTFINGERLQPNDMHVLHNGDEIRLGKLKARVYFREDRSSIF